MASRSRPKAEETINDLEVQTGKRAQFLHLDLSNLASVRSAAQEFARYVKLPRQQKVDSQKMG